MGRCNIKINTTIKQSHKTAVLRDKVLNGYSKTHFSGNFALFWYEATSLASCFNKVFKD